RADELPTRPTPKQALEALNDYIGDWHGSGSPERPQPDPRDIWRENASWTWRFKGDDAWLVLKIKDGKHFRGGELHYVPDKKRYRLTMTTTNGQSEVFEGRIHKDTLTLDRLDPKSHETQRLRMNLAADGARFIYHYDYRPRGRTVFYRGYQVGFTREGESLAATENKIECVVTGGLGKIPVSYKGQTYYVCCSGCLEAFNENPAKYIKEYEKRKASRK
ncbi:MAG TPA: YHS domain-containing protein, partial [Gemmataceae bacterium]|nr:YHS domain-containing protein [Gemmataceae bacterium]